MLMPQAATQYLVLSFLVNSRLISPQQTAKPQRQIFPVPFISEVSESFESTSGFVFAYPYVGKK